jgi:hypothetical protein
MALTSDLSRRKYLRISEGYFKILRYAVTETHVFDRIYIYICFFLTVVASVKGLYLPPEGHMHSLEQETLFSDVKKDCQLDL